MKSEDTVRGEWRFIQEVECMVEVVECAEVVECVAAEAIVEVGEEDINVPIVIISITLATLE